MIRTSEVVEPTTALNRILSILSEAKAGKKRLDSAMARRITRAANRGLIGEEDWPYVTEAEKTNPSLLKEQGDLPFDDKTAIHRRKWATRKEKPWYNAPPEGHPHSNA